MRDKLIELIFDSAKLWRYPVGNGYLFDYGKLADHLIANGVTLKPVKHGVWIKPEGFYWRLECSECGYYGSAIDEPIVPFNCCPNCGAKMEGEDNE